MLRICSIYSFRLREKMEVAEDYNAIIDVSSRLRMLESRYGVMRDRIFIMNQNMIDSYKKLNQEMKTIDDELKDMKKTLFSLEESMKDLLKELKFFARKEDIKVLEKYINLWNPLHFVTEEEVIKLIEQKEGEHHKHSNR